VFHKIRLFVSARGDEAIAADPFLTVAHGIGYPFMLRLVENR
jgi:hypothetical protein